MNLFRGHVAEAAQLLRKAPRLRPFLLATIVSNFNTGMLLLVVPLFLLDRGFTFLELGGVLSLTTVASVGVQVLAGRHPSTLGRPSVIVALMGVSVASFPFYVLVEEPWHFLVVNAFATLSSAAAGPGVAVFFAKHAPSEGVARAFALLGAATSLAFSAAIVVGGFLAAWNFYAVFLAGSGLALLAFLLVASALLDRPSVPLPPDAAALQRALDAAHVRLRHARLGLERRLPAPEGTNRNITLATVHVFLFHVSLAVYPVFFPLYLQGKGLDLGLVGMVIASSWLVFGMAQPLGARLADRTKRPHAVIVVSLLAAALLNVLLAFANLWLLVVAWALLGVADGIGRPVTSALLVGAVPDSRRSDAFGWTEAAESLANVVAPISFAFVILGFGMPVALLVVAALVVLAIAPLLGVRLLAKPPAVAPAPASATPAGGVL